MADFIEYVIDGSLFQAPTPYQPEWFSSWLEGTDFIRRRLATKKHPPTVDENWISRDSVCIVGRDMSQVTFVKAALHALTPFPLPFESLHFRSDDELRDGALLVSKAILVATFQPGRKLLDEEGDEGQLDAAYDEVCKSEGKVLVIYLNLPPLLYPRHPQPHLYHPRLENLIFPQQPVVKNLARTGMLLSLCEDETCFNLLQRERLLEWMGPFSKCHKEKKKCGKKCLEKKESAKKIRDMKEGNLESVGQKKQEGVFEGVRRCRQARKAARYLSGTTDSEEDCKYMQQESVPLIEKKCRRAKFRNFMRNASYGSNL